MSFQFSSPEFSFMCTQRASWISPCEIWGCWLILIAHGLWLWMSDEARVAEFGLKEMWKSPNGTIRNILNGNSQVLDAKKVYMYCGGLVVFGLRYLVWWRSWFWRESFATAPEDIGMYDKMGSGISHVFHRSEGVKLTDGGRMSAKSWMLLLLQWVQMIRIGVLIGRHRLPWAHFVQERSPSCSRYFIPQHSYSSESDLSSGRPLIDSI